MDLSPLLYVGLGGLSVLLLVAGVRYWRPGVQVAALQRWLRKR